MQQRYWLKIGLGAVAVFCVGMGIIVLARRSLAEVKALAHSTRPIGIPLAILPFQVDGERLGKVSRVDLLRSSPDDVSGFRVTVRLQDSAAAGRRLADCKLTLNRPDSFATRGGFGCTPDESASGLKQIGEVVFEPGGAVHAIFAPVASWREHRVQAMRAEAARLEAQGLADSAARLRIEADSAGALIEVRGDSDAALVRIQADSHGARMHIRDRSGREVFRLRADSTGASLSVMADSAGQKR
jgi:hypothetical protein